jgi:hypothetical protein
MRGVPPPTEAKAIVEKVGQTPAWDIRPDPGLAKRLGDATAVFKKGLICESQGFGVGAFAYYRRIVEDLLDELLTEIREFVSSEGLEEYSAALEKAKASHRAVDKIDHVKDLLPSALRPKSLNPLALLHQALSQGLHSESDEDCLEYAGSIRNALVFLVHQMNAQRESAEEFEKSLRAIASRKGEATPDSGNQESESG